MPVWNMAKIEAARFIREHSVEHLISGGAAGIDHICVQAFNAGFISRLSLYLPCVFDTVECLYTGETATVANYYHQKFKYNLGVDSLIEIQKAIDNGAEVIVGDGFHARNTLVAKWSTLLLAMTFGNGATLKDGGTADTVRKFNAQFPDKSWHLDLNDFKLYNPAIA